ncbi:translation initiation factor IF-1 domain protein [Streptococcus anginosus subsp. whileyi CCUG 39159]|uniref:Translation initiation factor IF-1 domain protein n=1 Tax=Streptococcus anginosus subsp. whileyi CCUG 39159 TaxID=1095729 RepID=I0S5R6_STRAP|nr:translation initiation factor IF-1 domain protein [Streptococcus anginosus subsp. whileyi CCUG 39159]
MGQHVRRERPHLRVWRPRHGEGRGVHPKSGGLQSGRPAVEIPLGLAGVPMLMHERDLPVALGQDVREALLVSPVDIQVERGQVAAHPRASHRGVNVLRVLRAQGDAVAIEQFVDVAHRKISKVLSQEVLGAPPVDRHGCIAYPALARVKHAHCPDGPSA